MSQADSARLPVLELLRALAAQLIVWHHLAYYGPMSDVAHALAPGLLDGLARYGRLAVQVFLVLAGFLAARALAPEGLPSRKDPVALVGRRAWRLLPPYWAAIGLAAAAAALARAVMSHEVVPAAPDPGALLAHATLLHTVLGIDSLSAGVWYVAIDLQLFALFVALNWLAGRLPGHRAVALPLLVTLGAAASMGHFNRDAGWDAWAPYFFGSYALGIASAWLGARGVARQAALAICLIALAALALDFRIRLALALATALAVPLLARMQSPRWPAPLERAVAFLARTSYATFLVHFPVLLVVAALVQQLAPASAALNAAGLLLTWLASLVLAALVHRRVEQPAAAWLARGAMASARARLSSLAIVILAVLGSWGLSL